MEGSVEKEPGGIRGLVSRGINAVGDRFRKPLAIAGIAAVALGGYQFGKSGQENPVGASTANAASTELVCDDVTEFSTYLPTLLFMKIRLSCRRRRTG